MNNLVRMVGLENDFRVMNSGPPNPQPPQPRLSLGLLSVVATERRGWGPVLLAPLVLLTTLMMIGCSKQASVSDAASNAATTANLTATTVTSAARSPVSEKLLSGQWVRPDGGYVVEVRTVEAGGRLEAYYFNPRPINVARADWRRADDGLHVFLELRDQNYPGATYKLRYLPEQDRLVGEYFQPVYQQTFEVYFIRQSR